MGFSQSSQLWLKFLNCNSLFFFCLTKYVSSYIHSGTCAQCVLYSLLSLNLVTSITVAYKTKVTWLCVSLLHSILHANTKRVDALLWQAMCGHISNDSVGLHKRTHKLKQQFSLADQRQVMIHPCYDSLLQLSCSLCHFAVAQILACWGYC